ncbi:MAG: hypothetical protein PHO80_01830, partial [Candidatus Gracilibacteria bacterium]|nr:hypothetical protein [Candidatus Gracilibacteria bacterium]
QFIQDYIKGLEDDFNTVEAIAVVFEFFKFTNSSVGSNSLLQSEKLAIIDMLKNFDAVLSLFDFSIFEKEEKNNIPAEVSKLFQERTNAKQEKNYELADAIREKLSSMGWKVVDDKNGSRVEKI